MLRAVWLRLCRAGFIASSGCNRCSRILLRLRNTDEAGVAAGHRHRGRRLAATRGYATGQRGGEAASRKRRGGQHGIGCPWLGIPGEREVTGGVVVLAGRYRGRRRHWGGVNQLKVVEIVDIGNAFRCAIEGED